MSCDEDPLALRLFGLILMATSLARTAIWAYATLKPPLVHEPLDRASIWSGLALSAFPALVYVVAFAIAGVSPRASLAVYRQRTPPDRSTGNHEDHALHARTRLALAGNPGRFSRPRDVCAGKPELRRRSTERIICTQAAPRHAA